jgi:hypothetical protein
VTIIRKIAIFGIFDMSAILLAALRVSEESAATEGRPGRINVSPLIVRSGLRDLT